TSGSSVSFSSVVRNGAGDVMVPAPPISVTVVPIGAPAGPTPTVVGGNIVIDAATQGAFTVASQVVGLPVTDSDTLAVLAPSTQNQPITQLSAKMIDTSSALDAAVAALAAGDLAAASAPKAALQATTAA